MANRTTKTGSRPVGQRGKGAAARRSQQRRRTRGRGAVVAAVVIIGAVVLIVVTRGGGNDGATGTDGFVGGDLHSVVALPDGRVFVGGHDAVTVSQDGGRSWTQVATLAHADAMGWGQRATTLFVSGHPGLNRSDDHGSTFRRTNGGLADTDMHSFGAGASTLYGAGPRLGVVASTDDGRTWQQRSPNAGQAFFGRMLVDGADDQHLFATDVQAGPVESRDGGRSWSSLTGLRGASWLSSPDGGHSLLASGSGSAARSLDGGRTWQALQLPAGAMLVEAAPGDARRVYAAGLSGNDARLWVSSDGGANWASP